MRSVTLAQLGTIQDQPTRDALKEIERASRDNDIPTVGVTGLALIAAATPSEALTAIGINTRLAKTGTYSVTSDDICNTIALGGSAFYSLTFPNASTLDANHFNIVLNEDTVRAKTIVLTGGTNFLLYPGQSALVYASNNVWRVLGQSRWVLTGSVTINVSVSAGSDSNDGLASGSGNALATIQAAINAVMSWDINTQAVTIQLANGTYTVGCRVTSAWLGSTIPTLKGDTTTPANVLISTTSVSAIYVSLGGTLNVQGLELRTTTSGDCLQAYDNGRIYITGLMRFGACAGFQISAQHSALFEAIAQSWQCSGGALSHVLSQTGGSVHIHDSTITFSNTPNFSTATVTVTGLGQLYAATMTFTNGATVTGTRFLNFTNSNIDVGGGGVNYFPGNVAGTTGTGAQYN